MKKIIKIAILPVCALLLAGAVGCKKNYSNPNAATSARY